MKKKIIITISLLVSAFILVFLVTCIPKNININYPAILYSNDNPNVVTQTSIVMNGKLFAPLFFDPKYTGTCIIKVYDLGEEYNLFDIKFAKEQNGWGVLAYETALPYGRGDLEFLGYIWVSKNMSEICINGVEPEDVGINGDYDEVIISAPAETKEEAVQIANQMRGFD